MGTIAKPVNNPVIQQAYVQTLQAAGSTTIESQFMALSVISKGTSGTFNVTVGSNSVQAIPYNVPFNLGYIGKPYSQDVVVDGGADVLEIGVIY